MLELEEEPIVEKFVQEPEDVPAWVQTFQDSYLQMTDALIKSDQHFATCQSTISRIIEIHGLKGNHDESIYYTNAMIFCGAMVEKVADELTALNDGVKVELDNSIPTDVLPPTTRHKDFDPMSLSLIKFYNHLISQFAGRGTDLSKQQVSKRIVDKISHGCWIGSEGRSGKENFDTFIENSFTRKKGEVRGHITCYVADSWKVPAGKVDWKNGCRDDCNILVNSLWDALKLLDMVHKPHKPMAEIVGEAIQKCFGNQDSTNYGTVLDFPHVSFVFRKAKFEIIFEEKSFDRIADFLKQHHPHFNKV